MVAILLATYNSEKYIAIQLYSILAQTCKDWQLYVRDDGSIDGTVDILAHFSSLYSNIHILDDSVKHRGAKNGFFYLLENVDADYYMFCDHDDFWLPNKIECCIEEMKKQEKQHQGIPVCVYTDAVVVNERYEILDKSLWHLSKIKPSISERMPYLLMFNSVTGCTMLFNKLAKKNLLPVTESVPMHDVWVAYSVVRASGVLVHKKQSTLLYCQHGNNVVGANNVSLSYIRRKVKMFRQVMADNKKVFLFINETYKIGKVRYVLSKVLYSLFRII